MRWLCSLPGALGSGRVAPPTPLLCSAARGLPLAWGSFEDCASGLGLVKSGEPSDVHLAVSRGGYQGRSPALKPCGAEYLRLPGVAWSWWEIQGRVLVSAAAATLWEQGP